MKTVRVVALGLDLGSSNFGCAALGLSFLEIIKSIAIKKKLYFEIVSVNYNHYNQQSKYFEVRDLKIRYKSINFYYNFICVIKNSDFIFDFTGGDSFTDIYGKGRFIKETLLKEITLVMKKTLILGPQTIGPFNRVLIRNWGKHILKRSTCVYVRDGLSYQYAKELGTVPKLTTDIAFLLPIEKSENYNEVTGIGLNVSALMLNNGYSGSSLGLKLDYLKFCSQLIERLRREKFDVHLIAHVILDEGLENDYGFCRELKKKHPYVKLAPKFISPMQAKAYMANLDCLIGARMHATIGAFSMGVPIIAVSYSRKFQGLYNSIDYPYIIDAKKMSEQEAIIQIMNWIGRLDDMRKQLQESLQIVSRYNNEFIEDVSNMFVNKINKC